MKNNLFALGIVLVVVVFLLVSYASAKNIALSMANEHAASQGDVIWGTFDRGIQISGGSQCTTEEDVTTCLWEMTVSWPRHENAD
jgi:hypothetical protein